MRHTSLLRRLIAGALVLGLGLMLPSGCAGTRHGPAIVVGGSETAEQRLLGAITLTLLREQGYRVVDMTALGGDGAVRMALETARVDIAWAYTGDTWLVHLGHQQPFTDAEEVYRRVRDADAENGITWLGPAPAHRRPAVIITAEMAESGNVRSLDGLVRHRATVNPYLRACAPPELQGVSGLQGLERVYGLRIEPDLVRSGDVQACYEALVGGDCDCALGYSNDMDVAVHDLRVLEDGRGFFPASSLAVGVRSELLEGYPELGETLSDLTAAITDRELRDTQMQVLDGRLELRAAARSFLRRSRLLPAVGG